MQRYKRLWEAFVNQCGDEYEKEKGVPVKLIKRIGYSKFIKANGWVTPDDVIKWKTDKLDVIPCPHCGKDFGVLDETLGLCEKCLPLFDLRKFYTDLNEAIASNKQFSELEVQGRSIEAFLVSKDVRKYYLSKDNKPTFFKMM